ncbi:MAG: PRC-barrel domain-containing protein [Chloroflexi bacterium]|nr:PRC-barrel domain-containing protein [Chloroflexota bacterium]
MLLKDLRGLPVIDPTAARKVGIVRNYQVDPVAGAIAAIDVNAAEGEAEQRIPAQRIRRVGQHAVILTGRAGTSQLSSDLNQRWLDEDSLVGLEVLGDDGNRIGHLLDARFNQDTLKIDAYLLRSGLLARFSRGGGRILPNTVHACSRELMMVTTGRMKELPSVADEPASTLSLPLKAEDGLTEPQYEPVEDGHKVSYEPVADGHPVSANR